MRKVKNNFKRKKGQVTIFVIIAIIIVAAVLLILFLRGNIIPNPQKGIDVNPESFLDSCLKESLQDTIEEVGLKGGSIEPETYKTFMFEGEGPVDISYLCYTKNYYERCVNQQPMLINRVKEEIGRNLEGDINICWNEMGIKYEKEGYVVDAQRIRGYDIALDENRVSIIIDGVMSISRSGETAREELFKASVSSKFYDIVKVSQEIVSQEGRFCDFNSLGYMLNYPEYKINKFVTTDSVKIYTVENKNTGEKFRFAVRTCVIPPGF